MIGVAIASGSSGLPPASQRLVQGGRQKDEVVVADAERVAEPQAELGLLARVSNAMVALHKEQFGRGPVRSRAAFAGDDTLICTFEDALLPAEQAMVEMGHKEASRDRACSCSRRRAPSSSA